MYMRPIVRSKKRLRRNHCIVVVFRVRREGESEYSRSLASGYCLFAQNHSVTVLREARTIAGSTFLVGSKYTWNRPGKCTWRRTTGVYTRFVANRNTRHAASGAEMYRAERYLVISSFRAHVASTFVVVLPSIEISCRIVA